MAIDAKRLLKEGLFETQGPLQSLVQDLDQIERIYQESAAKRRMLRRVAGLWAIAAVVFIILAGTTANGAFGFGVLVSFIVAFGLLIYSFVYGRKVIRY